MTDAKGNQHGFNYDKANRLTKETRPLGGAIQYSYDAAGNLTQRKDAGNNTRAYTYNAAGRMTAEVHKLGGSTTDQQVSYSYDADGQLTGYEQTDGGGALNCPWTTTGSRTRSGPLPSVATTGCLPAACARVSGRPPS